MHIKKEKHHNQTDLKKYFQTDKVKPLVKKVLEIRVPESSLKVLKYKRQTKFTKKAEVVPGSTDWRVSILLHPIILNGSIPLWHLNPMVNATMFN